ncbi:MAG: GTP 3',8-cyclase MoaA [Desulfatitalea sp.]|nr:GTP 3',8-cyclase MoaA [Desulfatitalea sp.]
MTSANSKGLVDGCKRSVTYLRVSVTDRCNLHCRYCITHKTQWLPKGQVLTLEEIYRMVRIAVGLGITKVRLTGGEPLCRKDVLGLVARLSRLNGLEDLSLTTNGTLLAAKARALRQAGLQRINISLDTLDAAMFRQLTGSDLFEQVWRGIMAAADEGFEPVKINTVVMNGCNDAQIERLADLSRQYPFHIRFIEYMPIGIDPHGSQDRFMPMDEVRRRLERMGPLVPVANGRSDGPAMRFRFENAPGEIGFIGAMSNHFCHRCNRIRLTADGHLRPCLLSDEQVDVIGPLRSGGSDADLSTLFAETLARKGDEHHLNFCGNGVIRTQMVTIGG